jgi:uncharacterized protein YcaQ
VTVHQLTRTEARRIAIQAQLLDNDRPSDLMETARRLTVMQLDQTAAVAPSADLVAWSRLGSSRLKRDELADALADQRLIELRGMIRPAEDIALYRAEMAAFPGTDEGWRAANNRWVEANDGGRRDILARLRQDGPLPAAELPDTCDVPWRSTGWNNNRNRTMMLEMLECRGEIAVVGRDGRDRLWDLASRVFPDDPAVPLADARRIRDEKRLHSLGIARSHGPECPVEPIDVREVGEPAVVEGVRGSWRVDPTYLGKPFSGRAAVLSPIDRLIYDRKRMTELFEFDYQLEMYKPAAKRRWGYYALPILYGDRFVGKLDATSDRKAGVLHVRAIHRDVEFTKTMAAAIDREISDLAHWLQLDLDLPD